jgi:hypothetical protein
MESISKNLWLLLTLVIPGLFTYGLWRLSLFFITELPESLTPKTLEQIDASNMTTTCIIFAFALMQQAVAIAIEAVIYYFLNKDSKKKSARSKKEFKDEKSMLKTLFCERFVLASKGQLNEQAERIVGNFFLSMNVSIGICLLIAYFAGYIGFGKSQSVIIGLIVLLPAALVTTFFRMITAEKIITECGKTQANQDQAQKTE